MTLRARLLIGLGVVLALFVVLGVVVVAVQRSQLIGQLDDQLEAIAPLERPGGGPGPEPVPGRPTDTPISDVYIAVIEPDGAQTILVQGQLLDSLPDIDTAAVSMATGEASFTFVDSKEGSSRFRVLVDPVPAAGLVNVIALPTTDVDQTVRQLIYTFVVAGLALSAMLGVLAWWVSRLGLRPISDMTDTAEAIAAGERSQRAPEPDGSTEAGQLARALNSMLDQRDEAEDRLRQFVSDASHELRTPLTSIRGYLDLYEAGGFREPGQLDDAVRRMQAESGRMASLVDNLLYLARLDEHQPLKLAPVDLGDLIRDVCADARTVRPDRDVTVDAPASGELVSIVDGHKLQQLVSSLVDNAITHGPDAAVHVRAGQDADAVVISVIDDGPGLVANQAEHVFDRFYRGDASRSGAVGGSGLGLAIAKSVVEAHDGEIHLTTAPDKGCEFTIRIPVRGGG